MLVCEDVKIGASAIILWWEDCVPTNREETWPEHWSWRRCRAAELSNSYSSLLCALASPLTVPGTVAELSITHNGKHLADTITVSTLQIRKRFREGQQTQIPLVNGTARTRTCCFPWTNVKQHRVWSARYTQCIKVMGTQLTGAHHLERLTYKQVQRRGTEEPQNKKLSVYKRESMIVGWVNPGDDKHFFLS